MSKEAVLELLKTGAEEPELRDLISTADSPATVVKMAAKKGYDFTESELLAVWKEIVAAWLFPP